MKKKKCYGVGESLSGKWCELYSPGSLGDITSLLNVTLNHVTLGGPGLPCHIHHTYTYVVIYLQAHSEWLHWGQFQNDSVFIKPALIYKSPYPRTALGGPGRLSFTISFLREWGRAVVLFCHLPLELF